MRGERRPEICRAQQGGPAIGLIYEPGGQEEDTWEMRFAAMSHIKIGTDDDGTACVVRMHSQACEVLLEGWLLLEDIHAQIG
jgi:hypothetical protein